MSARISKPDKEIASKMGLNRRGWQDTKLAPTSVAMKHHVFTMATLFLLTVMMSPVPAQRLEACDRNVCVCNPSKIRCIGTPNLIAVPKNIPPNSTAISIVDTALARIERNDFQDQESIETLFLQQNQITFIHKFALRNMYRLRTLNLERNELVSLDPDGLLFQHLPSVTLINLQDNQIEQLNRYSFLTTVATTDQLSVKMRANPIQCNCDVLTMKNWIEATQFSNRISFNELVCANVGQRYDQLPTNSPVFGSCAALNCTLEKKDTDSSSYPPNSNRASGKDILRTSTTIAPGAASTDGDSSSDSSDKEDALSKFLDSLLPNGNPFEDVTAILNPLFQHEDPSIGSGLKIETVTTIKPTKEATTSDPNEDDEDDDNDENVSGKCVPECSPGVQDSDSQETGSNPGMSLQEIFQRLQETLLLNNRTSLSEEEIAEFREAFRNNSSAATTTKSNPEKNAGCKCDTSRNTNPGGNGNGNGNSKSKVKDDGKDDDDDDDDDSEEADASRRNLPECGDKSNIFNTMFRCRTCEKEHTNHACNLQPAITCTGLQMVCLRSVSWEDSTRSMLISSRCEKYNSCLDREARNANGCGSGPGYQNSGRYKCEFCCMGPTCTRNSVGGRTYDLTFYVSYVSKNGVFQAYMGDVNSSQYKVYRDRVTTGMRADIRSVRGGIDIYLDSIVPEDQASHKVTLRIEITAMTFVPETTVLSALESDLGTSAISPTGFLSLENVVQSTVALRKNLTGTLYCSAESTTSSKGTFFWDAEPAGAVHMEACPHQDANTNPPKYASRRCIVSALGRTAVWAPVDDTDCPEKAQQVEEDEEDEEDEEERRNKKLQEISEMEITEENALEVSDVLEENTLNIKNPTAFASAVKGLENLVNISVLERDVCEKVVETLSNLLTADIDVMRSGEEQQQSSERMLGVIDTVTEKAPLDANNQFKIESDNLAIAAQGVNKSETRDVTLTASKKDFKDSGNPEKISVGFSSKDKKPSMDKTNLVLPLSAVREEDRSKLSRVSFVVHKSDKLFAQSNSRENQSMQDPEPILAVNVNEESNQKVSDGTDGDDEEKGGDEQRTGRYFVKVNSMVLSASVADLTLENLSENVTMTFEHESDNSTNPRCVFWDVNASDWSSEGCGIVTTSPGVTQCGCNHLTNFALLMDVYQEGTGLGALDRKILSYISYIGCGISLAALLLTLVTYALFRKLRRDNPSKILINLCLALLFSNLVYLIGMHDYSFDNNTACKVVAVLLHYFLLASLTWMAVEAFYMYLALILVFKTYFTNFILKCALFGWGVPLLVVIVTLAVDSTDNYGFINSGMCWLRNPAFYAAFVGPVCLILLVNCIAFGLVIKQLTNMSSSKLNKTDRNSTVQRLRGAIGIVILLGLTWIFAVFAIGEASVVFYYLFAIFNSLQGLFIFIFYCVLKKDAISAWKRVLPCFEEYSDSTKSSSNSRAVSQSGTNMNEVKIKSKPMSASSSMTTTSTVPDSRKASVTTILENANMYHTIDDRDIYTNLDNAEVPPSYSVIATSDPSLERYPYAEVPPTAYSYRNGNLSSPNKAGFSPTGYAHLGRQPFAPAFSYPDRYYQDQEPQQQQPPIPRPRVEGEIDTSNTAKVNDIRLRYERSSSLNSRSSNRSATNI